MNNPSITNCTDNCTTDNSETPSQESTPNNKTENPSAVRRAQPADPARHAESTESLMAGIDGLLFVHHQPMTVARIGELLEITPEKAMELIQARREAMDRDENSGLQIVVNEQGVQLATKARISQFIQRLEGQKLVSLSLPALETLSVIAVRQPITRPEIDALRGVNSDGVISTLLEKKLIYVVGEKPVIGRPRLYSTTQDFLYYFGLKSLKELPVPAVDFPPGFIEGQQSQEDEHHQASDTIEASQGLTSIEEDNFLDPDHRFEHGASEYQPDKIPETAPFPETASFSETAPLPETMQKAVFPLFPNNFPKDAANVIVPQQRLQQQESAFSSPLSQTATDDEIPDSKAGDHPPETGEPHV